MHEHRCPPRGDASRRAPGAAPRPHFVTRNLGTIISIVIILLAWGYPRVAMYLNPPPPKEALQAISGVVVRADRNHPHLRVRTDDAQEIELDFPGDFQFIFFGRWPQFLHPSSAEFKRLRGCEAVLQVDRLRYLPVPANPRVWSISCPQFSVGYEQLSRFYRQEIGLQLEEYYLILVAASLVFAANARDRKRARESQPTGSGFEAQ